MTQEFEYRLCPECGRLLRQNPEIYWCRNCWVIFGYEETKPHPNTQYLKKLAWFGQDQHNRYLICLTTGELLVEDIIKEELEIASIPERRQKYLEEEKRIKDQSLKLQAEYCLKEQLNKMSLSELTQISKG